MNTELSIFSKEKKTNANGAVHYEVVLNDGSEWVCDYQGENWKKAVLNKGKEELTEDFLLQKFLGGKRN